VADVSVIAHGFARSPIAALDAELSGWHPVDLAAVVVRESLTRARLSPSDVDEIVVGCAEPVGAQGAGLARAITLAADLPDAVSGMVLDRGETSGAAALHVAADALRVGRWSRVIVVGIGMASTVPPGASALNRTFGAPWGPGVADRLEEAGGALPAPLAAEAAVLELGADRADLDAWAQGSLIRRRAAPLSHAIVPVAARPGEACPLVRPGDPISSDTLREWGPTGELPPAFEPDGATTAATFAPPADAVAALILELADPDGRGDHEVPGADAALELLGSGRAAGGPRDPTGKVSIAVDRAVADAGVALIDLDAIEVAETSAAAALLVARALGHRDTDIGPAESSELQKLARPRRWNRHGGALATGDAGAAEELRLVVDAGGRLAPGRLLMTIGAGPSGSAASVWRGARSNGPSPAGGGGRTTPVEMTG
jgi:acetyl-CoA acyltransferase